MIEHGFHPEGVTILLERIELTRQLPKTVRDSPKYRQMATSVREVGIIEPPIVFPHGEREGWYLLLDGHVRLDILREMGETSVFCLIARDDEAFTYNRRVNRLATVQEHLMIRRALERGVSEERLSRALGIDVRTIRNRSNLLDGIHPEVVERLKDLQIGQGVFRSLRQMKPVRQIDVVERMVAANTFTETFAKALLVATPPEMLQVSPKNKAARTMAVDHLAAMEKEMANLDQRSRLVERTLGLDTLTLSITKRYIETLLNNEQVRRHLVKHHPDVLTELDRIVKMDMFGLGGV
ncbi:MAG: ParB N-terminal domain-containing protein [Magnetococcales bacterium]|nr:ParB N-terminal domain-containing protein [Magnetococcales bacterium]